VNTGTSYQRSAFKNKDQHPKAVISIGVSDTLLFFACNIFMLVADC
jgi:hypothetical protein